MTLQELRYIVAVADELNFTRAAARSFVSQPALSVAVQKIEDELDLLIFERRRSEVAVTPVGARIVAQARRVLEEVGRIKAIAREGRDPLVGPFRLGVIHTIGPYLLPDLLPALEAAAPELALEVEENVTPQLEALLRAEHLDAALVALPFQVPGVETRALYDEPFVVAVPARRRAVRPADLARERVFRLGALHCFSNQVAEACPEVVGRSGETLQGNSLETLRHMVASDLGITVLPCSAVSERYQMPQVRVVPFAAPAPSRRVAIAWRRSFARPAVIELVERCLRELAGPCIQPLAPRPGVAEAAPS